MHGGGAADNCQSINSAEISINTCSLQGMLIRSNEAQQPEFPAGAKSGNPQCRGGNAKTASRRSFGHLIGRFGLPRRGLPLSSPNSPRVRRPMRAVIRTK
jgi:hypothetical protein